MEKVLLRDADLWRDKGIRYRAQGEGHCLQNHLNLCAWREGGEDTRLYADVDMVHGSRKKVERVQRLQWGL